jgi:hypothetical protein
VAAQGGHNAESHNHNDVGNFIVYYDGLPVLVDVGVETYTAKTFSSDRYSIWTMQSAYHNLPTINGVMQKDGREYEALDVKYASDDKAVRFSLDMAHAYPAEAKVKSWLRKITLHRGQDVVVNERYSLDGFLKPFTLNLMTSCVPAVAKEGMVSLHQDAGGKGRTISLKYDESKFSAAVEPVALEDERLKASWGEKIYRIVLTSRLNSLEGEYSLTFREE